MTHVDRCKLFSRGAIHGPTDYHICSFLNPSSPFSGVSSTKSTPKTVSTSLSGCHDALGLTPGEYAELSRYFWGYSRVDEITDASSVDEDIVGKWRNITAVNLLSAALIKDPMADNLDDLCREYQEKAILIRAIGNKAGELRIDFFDFEKNLRFDKLPWELEGVRESREKFSEIIEQQCTVARA